MARRCLPPSAARPFAAVFAEANVFLDPVRFITNYYSSTAGRITEHARMYLVFQICFYTLPLTVVCYETDRGPEDVGLGEDAKTGRAALGARCR